MPRVHKLNTNESFSNSIVPVGSVLQFVGTSDNGKPTIKFKTADGTFIDYRQQLIEDVVSAIPKVTQEVF
jgi:hypothetical protein